MTVASTRENIVESADTLFYEQGFEATSFADIAATVGISRGNFYHHFRAKDDILDAVIIRRTQKTRDMLAEWEAASAGPRDCIRSFIRLLATNRAAIVAHGCPVGTLCSELAKLDHAAQIPAAEILGLFCDWLAEQFRLLGAGDRADALALHLVTWSQGVAAVATAFRDEGYIRREVEGLERWLDALVETSFDQTGNRPCMSPS